MIKYTFAVHHASYSQFLDELQNLGVVHVDHGGNGEVGGEAADLAAEVEKITLLIEKLRLFKPRKKSTTVAAAKAGLPNRKNTEPKQEEPTTGNNASTQWTETLNNGFRMLDTLENSEAQLEKLEETIKERVVWGEYSVLSMRELSRQGVEVWFYIVNARSFNPDWADNYPIEIIDRTNSDVYFICAGSEVPDLTPARRVSPPQEELKTLMTRAKTLREEITAARSQLEWLNLTTAEQFQQRLRALETRLDWLDIFNNRTNRAVEDKVMILEGWVPDNEEEKLTKHLDEKDIFYLRSTETEDENPPVQLRNNRFVRLFEPIGSLFDLPAYAELDLTVYFAPFFMLFFGFCVGDAGYGLVTLLGASAAKLFIKGSARSLLSLGQIFGLSTMAVGFFCGTFLGIELIDIPFLKNIRGIFLDSTMLFVVALILGLIQILFAMVIKIKNQLRQTDRLLALNTVGWLLLIVSAILFEFILPTGGVLSPVLKMVSIVAYSAAVALIMFFAATGAVFTRLGLGLWNVYCMVTGIFGDLLSYIRLFALGVASAILGLVINQIAMTISVIPHIGPVLFLLIVLIGHTGNLALASLSAFVHPVRLTFVEFYKNAGFRGGGKAYDPFRKK